MKAITYPAKNEVRIVDLPDPQAGEGEVVLEVRAGGLCHTDIEVLCGNYGTSTYPVVPCHEFSGVISEIGRGVSGLSVGDRVVVDPNLECGSCHACQRGWAHLCENLGAYGVTVDGGFAERSVVLASAVHPIGDMPFQIAALAEPIGCVLNGIEAATRDKTASALIFGAGPMGLLMAMALRAGGVPEIFLVDVNPSRLALSEGFGFIPIGSGSAELEDLKQAIDLVVDATGAPPVAARLVDYVANGGAGLFFGVCPSDARIEISPFEVFRRQLTLVGSHSLNHNIPQALRTIRSCGSDIARLVSHRMQLEDIAPVLLSKKAPEGSLKIQVEFPHR